MATDTRPMEHRLSSLIKKVGSGELTPKDSGVGAGLNALKSHNLAAYEELLGKYKEALKTAIRDVEQ